jgi:four helix bundle protein
MGHRDLRVFQRAYSLALTIFTLSKDFPRGERFSLTDQIRRSSRSVAANIAEAFRRSRYPSLFASRITDADAEATETQVWLDFARDCGYLAPAQTEELRKGYEEIGRVLGKILKDPSRYRPK